MAIYPATHFVTNDPAIERSLVEIRREMEERCAWFEEHGKILEAHRLRQRTQYDMEMLREMGYCSGIENYSRILLGKQPGATPNCLLDYFPDDFLCFVDESHMTLPQIRAMSEGDRSRKQHARRLRLPPAERAGQPAAALRRVPREGAAARLRERHARAEFELANSVNIAEQIIRPTGLVDPDVEVRPTEGQIDDLMNEIRRRVDKDQRVLVTTLTKRMAEDLTDYLIENGFKVRYLHSEVDTLERIQIVRDLRLGEFDVLVGINLLREGLDLPEVTLVAILDADKEGFLRGQTSLIQTIGRAARNVDGRVIMYADKHDGGHGGGDRRDQPSPRQADRVQRGARHHAAQRRQGRERHLDDAQRRGGGAHQGPPCGQVGGQEGRDAAAPTSRSSSRASRPRCSRRRTSSSSSTRPSCATRSRSSAKSSAGEEKQLADAMHLQRLVAEAEGFGADRAAPLPARAVVVDDRVNLKCRVPLCSGYGHNLMCPPAVMPGGRHARRAAQVRRRAGRPARHPAHAGLRRRAAGRQDLRRRAGRDAEPDRGPQGEPEPLRAPHDRPRARRVQARLPVRGGILRRRVRALRRVRRPGPGEACRHPFEARPSMEAVGIDVVATAEAAGLSVELPAEDHPAWTGLLLID